MQRSHSRHTLPAAKMLPVAVFRKWRGDRPEYKPTQRQRAYAKRFHTRKSRLYLKQQIREALTS